MVLLYLGQIRNKIRFVRLDPSRPFDELPANNENGENKHPESILSETKLLLVKRAELERKTYIKYENRKDGTSQFPFKKTV